MTVAVARSSWRRCDTLCTSSFMDDVTFGRNWPHGAAWKTEPLSYYHQRRCHTEGSLMSIWMSCLHWCRNVMSFALALLTEMTRAAEVAQLLSWCSWVIIRWLRCFVHVRWPIQSTSWTPVTGVLCTRPLIATPTAAPRLTRRSVMSALFRLIGQQRNNSPTWLYNSKKQINVQRTKTNVQM